MAQEIKLGPTIWTDWQENWEFTPPIYKRHLDFNDNYVALIYSDLSRAIGDKPDLWTILFCGQKTQSIKDLFCYKFTNKEYKLNDIEMLKEDVDFILVKYDNLLIYS